jgi:NADH dehydrogenase
MLVEPRVVIVGGGFGGLAAARALRGAPVRITLVDRRNHHLFQPLLYQVATAGLSGPDVAAPIRQVLRGQRNATVLLAEATGIDPARRVVRLSDGELDYDYLVLAAGAGTSYFGHDDWAEHAPGLKSIEDAFEVRRRILLAYEAAERETDPERRKIRLTFVIIGGGPTGVELAGAIAEIAHHTLARNFRRFDPQDTRIVLVEGDRLLSGMSLEASRRAEAALRELGVELLLGRRVRSVDARGVVVEEQRIDAATIVWAAGVRASPLGNALDPTGPGGRVRVAPDLSVPEHPEVFVVGDMISLIQDGAPLPGVAQVAIQSGRHAAGSIRARMSGDVTVPFRYRDKGTMATIGRSAAVAEISGRTWSGFLAWGVWWLVHIFFLIGFRNRFFVMLEWIWAYVSWQRGARVIVGPLERKALDPPGRS